MSNLEKIIADLKDLDGKAVEVFGQPVTLTKAEEKPFLPQAVKIAEALLEYEVNAYLTKRILEAFEDGEEGDGFEYVKGFNSYNWSGNIDHDIQWHNVKFKGRNYKIVSFHRYGDVRGNYTVEAVILDDNEEDYFFYEAIDSADVYNSIKVNSLSYNVKVTAHSDMIEVEGPDGEVFEVCAECDKQSIWEAIEDHVKGDK